MSAAGGAAEASLLSQLTDMGFESAAASAALRATGFRNVEAAVLWLCGPDAEGAAGGASEPATGVPAASAYAVVNPDGTPSPAWVARVDGEFKVATRAASSTSRPLIAPDAPPSPPQVVLCVVRELNMGVGKVAAQAAHAAVGLLRAMQAARTPWLHAWEGAGEKTVVLDVATADAASLLAAKATQLGLPGARSRRRFDAARQAHARCVAVHAVLDAGRTEVAPGSFTVLAIGGASRRLRTCRQLR